MRQFFFALMIVLAGCSNVSSPHIRIEDPIGAPSWVQDALYGAARFWEEHENAYVIIDDTGSIKVEVKDLMPKYVGLFQPDGLGGGTIYLTPELGTDDSTPIEAACVASHETGHAFGMGHVEDKPSLMYPALNLLDDGTCPWSEEDRIEFCVATGHDCNGDAVTIEQTETQDPFLLNDFGGAEL